VHRPIAELSEEDNVDVVPGSSLVPHHHYYPNTGSWEKFFHLLWETDLLPDPDILEDAQFAIQNKMEVLSKDFVLFVEDLRLVYQTHYHDLTHTRPTLAHTIVLFTCFLCTAIVQTLTHIHLPNLGYLCF